MNPNAPQTESHQTKIQQTPSQPTKTPQIKTLPHIPHALQNLERFSSSTPLNSPARLYYQGDLRLLDAPLKVAIVGTRKPNQYARQFTATISAKLAQMGAVIVSGGALGIDIIAHQNAYSGQNLRTIMFSPSSLDIIYPKENRAMIKKISESALVISEYERAYMPHRFSFLERNRLVVALSDIVIIPQADLRSGSMHSARLAGELGKSLFVLPHRLGESAGTQSLLANAKAAGIYDVDKFVQEVCAHLDSENCEFSESSDEILKFCANAPSFQAAFARFGEAIFEYEMQGKIVRENGVVKPK